MESQILNIAGIDWQTIANVLLVITSTFFGSANQKVKKKFKQVVSLGKEATQTADHLSQSLKDNKISDPEAAKLEAHLKAIKTNWNTVVNKDNDKVS